MAFYEEGTIKNGYIVRNGDWEPYQAPPPSIGEDALGILGTVAKGVASIPQVAVKLGATLATGTGQAMTGTMPDWGAIRENYSPENNPVTGLLSSLPNAVEQATTALGGSTATNPLARGLQAAGGAIQEVTGPISPAVQTSLETVGLGLGASLGKAGISAMPTNMSGRLINTASELAPRTGELTRRAAQAVGETVLLKDAPLGMQTARAGLRHVPVVSRFAGLAQELPNTNVLKNEIRASVGLADDVPVTHSTISAQKQAISSKFDEFGESITKRIKDDPSNSVFLETAPPKVRKEWDSAMANAKRETIGRDLLDFYNIANKRSSNAWKKGKAAEGRAWDDAIKQVDTVIGETHPALTKILPKLRQGWGNIKDMEKASNWTASGELSPSGMAMIQRAKNGRLADTTRAYSEAKVRPSIISKGGEFLLPTGLLGTAGVGLLGQ